MGRSSKRKGDGFERQVVGLLRDGGLAAERVPLSGAMGGSFRGDIKLTVGYLQQSLECKRRARAFASLADWLGQNYALVIRDDRCEPMVVMAMHDWIELVSELNTLILTKRQHAEAGS